MIKNKFQIICVYIILFVCFQTIPLIAKNNNKMISPLISMRLNTLEIYDVGLGVIYGKKNYLFSELNGNHKSVGLEIGLLRTLDNSVLGNGVHLAIKTNYKRYFDKWQKVSNEENVIGVDFQIGISGHSPPLCLNVGFRKLLDENKNKLIVGVSYGI